MSATTELLSFLAPVAIKATVLLAVAAAVDVLALRRRASASARHALWALALGGLLVLPALEWVLPGLRVPLPGAPAAAMLGSESRHRPTRAAVPQPPEATADAPAPPAPAGSRGVGAVTTALPGAPRDEARDAAVRRRPAEIILGAYLAGVLLLLVRVAAEQLIVRRLAHGAAPVRDAEWGALLRSAAGALGLRRRVVLLQSDIPTMPLTWGIARPFVLLPPEADAWSPARRRAVLLHELAHVARHDCLSQTLAAVASAVYWPHPGVWWAASRLRTERELACDDQVLTLGVPSRDYAEHLLEIARAHSAPAGLASLAAGMACPSQLEVRLRAAIDGTRIRTTPGRRGTAIGALLAAGLVLTLAGLRPGGAEAASAPPGRRAVSPLAPIGVLPGSLTGRPTAPAADGAPRALADGLPGVRTAGSGGDRTSRFGAARDTEVARSAPSRSAPQEPPVGTSDPMPDATPALGRAPFDGRWALRLASDAEARSVGLRATAPIVHVALWAPGLNTFYLPLDSLDGLTASQVASSGSGTHFRLRRDAGAFLFEGKFDGGRGAGRFEFTPDPDFADALVRRSMDRPTPEQQFSMARHDVGLAFLDELEAQGYARPSTATLVRAGLNGPELPELRELGALDYRVGTLEAVMRLHVNGVSPTLIRELAGLGYRGLSADDLVRLKSNGVDADGIRSANARAGRRLSVDELASGHTGGDAATPAPTSTPLAGRWVIASGQGGSVDLELFWDDDTNWRRWWPRSDLRGLSDVALRSPVSAPVDFRIEQDAGSFEFAGSFRGGRGSGEFRFHPNREFVSTLRSLGIEAVGDVTDHQLKNLAYGRMSAAAIRDFKALGFEALTLREVLDMAIFQVTPDYVRAMRSLGVRGTNTVEAVVDLRHLGVPEEYVRELAALGYRGLSSRQVIELRQAGVTPAFIRELRAAGDRDLSPEELIRRRGQRRGGASSDRTES